LSRSWRSWGRWREKFHQSARHMPRLTPGVFIADQARHPKHRIVVSVMFAKAGICPRCAAFSASNGCGVQQALRKGLLSQHPTQAAHHASNLNHAKSSLAFLSGLKMCSGALRSGCLCRHHSGKGCSTVGLLRFWTAHQRHVACHAPISHGVISFDDARLFIGTETPSRGVLLQTCIVRGHDN
jgi:hypothetical protein